MRLSRLATLFAIAAIGLAMTLAAAQAQTAQKKKRVAQRDVTERITVVDENGRVRTRVTVRPRSYLDPGKESLPFDHHYHDYAVMPGYGSGPLYDKSDWRFSNSRMPLPGPWDVPGYARW